MGLCEPDTDEVRTLAVVGLGYIGLPTAALFSQHLKVVGVDIDSARVSDIMSGKFNSKEPGLSRLIGESISRGRLTVTTELPAADAYIVAVPTPIGRDKKPILDYVHNAVRSIASQLKGGELIVIESTCPPRTTQGIVDFLASSRSDLAIRNSTETHGVDLLIDVAYCPERILPGNALRELRDNNRIIGGHTAKAAERARNLYRLICDGEVSVTDAATAEMAKLVENSFRDVNLAFANEVSIICEELGVDVWELIALANQHPRVNILTPGTGVGGHCIAVDPWFITDSVSNAPLIETARNVNDSKPFWVADRIQKYLDENDCRRVTLLGLTFKADIDDLRESPALLVATRLIERNPSIYFTVVEPNVNGAEILTASNVQFASIENSVRQTDLVAVLVDHSAFKAIDWDSVTAEVLDFRGVR